MLTPAHVKPVATRVGKHAGEVRVGTCGNAWSWKCGTGEGVGPSVATVGGAIDLVSPGCETAAFFVHASNVHVARNQVAGDLDVADEWAGGGQLSLGPGVTDGRRQAGFEGPA